MVDFFLSKISAEQGTVQKTISEDAIKSLQSCDWTGNIRELRNVVERLIILGNDPVSADDVKKYVLVK